MKKILVVTIRYSLLSSSRRRGWTIGRSDRSSYKEQLLSSARLRARSKIFGQVTLPSLVNLNHNKPFDVDFKVQIITSKSLPSFAKVSLEETLEDHKFIDLIYLDENESNFEKCLATAVSDLDDFILANTRLDDDDALSKDYFEAITPYMSEPFNGFVISPSRGFASLLDPDGKIISIRPYHWQFSSAGQSLITRVTGDSGPKSIYDCGNHRKTDLKRPTLLISKMPTFIRSFHQSNDSAAKFSGIIGEDVKEDEARRALTSFGLN